MLDSAELYQSAKDEWEKNDASDEMLQDACMVGQYHNDMNHIEVLSGLIDKCKGSGCNMQDLVDLGIDETYDAGKFRDPNAPLYVEGPIEFPDCGSADINKDCFFKEGHYKVSGWLDFLSFLSYPLALLGCTSFGEYNYDFCFANFTYVLIDAYLRRAVPRTDTPEDEGLLPA